MATTMIYHLMATKKLKLEIPSTGGWRSFSTELNGEPRIFCTEYFKEGSFWAGTIVAVSWEEAKERAAKLDPPQNVCGILVSEVDYWRFN